MHEYTDCMWYLAVVIAMCMSVSMSELLSFSLFDGSARTLGVPDAMGGKRGLINTGTAVWLKCQQRDDCFWPRHISRYSKQKIVYYV